MDMSRDFFKKIRDTKRKYNEKMGTKKVRNVMDLTEAEDMKKRWNYTKTVLMIQITLMV